LATYPWPGNIRELENVMERAVLFCDAQKLALEHLPQEVRGGNDEPGTALPMSGVLGDGPLNVALSAEGGLKEHVKVAMSRLEREIVSRALKQTGGNVTHAARLLKISRKGLQLKMKELNLREGPSDKD
jgi:two-component system response regulator AtoC